MQHQQCNTNNGLAFDQECAATFHPVFLKSHMDSTRPLQNNPQTNQSCVSTLILMDHSRQFFINTTQKVSI